MTWLPRWVRDRRVLYAGGAALGWATLCVVLSPKKAAAALPATPGLGTRLLGDALTARPGKTYRATIVTHGAANAASGTQVMNKAAGMGFKNVTVQNTRPPRWPSTLDGDWFVTATYAGASPLNVQRKNGSFVAGADVIDVWEA